MIDRLEKLLVRVTLLGLALMAAVQLVLTGSTTTMLDFSVPAPVQSTDAEMTVGQNIGSKSYITFSLVDYSSLSKAVIYVNGRKRTDFSEKYVTLGVYPGDHIEIDTTFYTKPVSVKVEKNDGRVVELPEQTVLTLKSERRALKAANID